MFLQLIRSEFQHFGKASIAHGDRQLTESLLAIVAYISLVGMSYLLFDFYLKSKQNAAQWIFAYFQKNTLALPMDFEVFQKEQQFDIRDWTASNEADKKMILQLKIELGECPPNEDLPDPANEHNAARAKGEENKLSTISDGVNTEKRVFTKLPSPHNSASLEASDIEALEKKSNQGLMRRLKREKQMMSLR
jgi:hypothetical protein